MRKAWSLSKVDLLERVSKRSEEDVGRVGEILLIF